MENIRIAIFSPSNEFQLINAHYKIEFSLKINELVKKDNVGYLIETHIEYIRILLF